MRTRFFISIVVLSFFPAFVCAQMLGVSVPKKEAAIGERVSARVYVSSPTQPINAVSGTLSFPASLSVLSISREGSIIDFWTQEPQAVGGSIRFEGVSLNPGYQGSSGTLFTVVFSGKKSGLATLTFNNAAILANDGLGSNIITGVGSATLRVGGALATTLDPVPGTISPPTIPTTPAKLKALPVITDYSAVVDPKSVAYLKGKGEPGAITKIVFRDSSFKSVGEQFIASLQTKKRELDEVLVKNDPETGEFQYNSGASLVAGAYNATPFLIDEEANTERPGLGVQLLVSDSPIVRALVVLVNVLALLIPVVGLGVLIYFIPWYSFRRMRVIKRRLGLEEDKLELSEHQLKRQDTLLEHDTNKLLDDAKTP